MHNVYSRALVMIITARGVCYYHVEAIFKMKCKNKRRPRSCMAVRCLLL